MPKNFLDSNHSSYLVSLLNKLLTSYVSFTSVETLAIFCQSFGRTVAVAQASVTPIRVKFSKFPLLSKSFFFLLMSQMNLFRKILPNLFRFLKDLNLYCSHNVVFSRKYKGLSILEYNSGTRPTMIQECFRFSLT